MSGNALINLKRQKRIVVVLCTIVSPGMFFLLYTWQWLIEALREDDYGYGELFYVVITSITLMCNALIVQSIYKSSSIEEKILFWLKSSLLAVLLASALGLLALTIYLIAYPAQWNFG